MAYIVMAYIVMAYIFMAYIVMAYIVMAYIVVAGARRLRRLRCLPAGLVGAVCAAHVHICIRGRLF